MTVEQAVEALKNVMDPELGKNLIELNMARNIQVKGNNVAFDLFLTTPACPLKMEMKENSEKALKAAGAEFVTIDFKSEVKDKKTPNPSDFINKEAFEGIKNIIPVYSAKGGVGKSSVAVNTALSLVKTGAKVGLLDLDVYGPSVPRMVNVSEAPDMFGQKLLPPMKDGLKLMSIGLLMKDSTKPVIWRGPLVNGVIKQLFEDVEWGNLDYLVVDLPPGTGDIQITFAQNVPVSGAVFVSTPQGVALDDTVKGIKMFRQMNVPILGIVVNMSYFECPHCGKKTEIFPVESMDKHLKDLNIPVLGELPIDPAIALAADKGESVLNTAPDSISAKALTALAGQVAAATSMIELGKNAAN